MAQLDGLNFPRLALPSHESRSNLPVGIRISYRGEARSHQFYVTTYLFYRSMNNTRQGPPESAYDLTGNVRT